MLNSLKKSHRDARGLETLQVVAILAVAAIILAVIRVFWNDIKKWFDSETSGTTTDWEKAK